MTKKDKKAALEQATADNKAEKKKKPGKKGKATADVAAETPKQPVLELSGKVGTVRVCSNGSGESTFHFTLKGKNNRGPVISVERATAEHAAAMASVVLSAAASGGRITVHLADSNDGARVALEIEAQFG